MNVWTRQPKGADLCHSLQDLKSLVLSESRELHTLHSILLQDAGYCHPHLCVWQPVLLVGDPWSLKKEFKYILTGVVENKKHNLKHRTSVLAQCVLQQVCKPCVEHPWEKKSTFLTWRGQQTAWPAALPKLPPPWTSIACKWKRHGLLTSWISFLSVSKEKSSDLDSQQKAAETASNSVNRVCYKEKGRPIVNCVPGLYMTQSSTLVFRNLSHVTWSKFLTDL